MLFNIFSATATAQPDDEFLDLYKAYFEDNNIIEIEPSSNILIYSNKYNCYAVTKRLSDFCDIYIFTGAETDIDLSELTDKMGYSPDMFSISSEYYRNSKTQFIEITFYTQDYNIKSDISRKLYDLLKAEYKIKYAYIRTYNELASETQGIDWDNFYTTDEFGYEVTTDEQLSKKQILKLKEAIASNNFTDVAEINDDGKIIINEKSSDIERLRFALWLREKYGYYATTAEDVGGKLYYNPPASTIEVIHYTELSGDVNNDNHIDIDDINMLHDYILKGTYRTDLIKPYECFNVKNADLTEDGVIDIFDLVLLKKQITG